MVQPELDPETYPPIDPGEPVPDDPGELTPDTPDTLPPAPAEPGPGDPEDPDGVPRAGLSRPGRRPRGPGTASGAGLSRSRPARAYRAGPGVRRHGQCRTPRFAPTLLQISSTMIAPMIDPMIPAGCRKPSWESLWNSR